MSVTARALAQDAAFCPVSAYFPNIVRVYGLQTAQISGKIEAESITEEEIDGMAAQGSNGSQEKKRSPGVRTIIALLRPFYRHKLIGADTLNLDADTPCIFVCNHGEIYGPVVTTLYLPFPYRPWVTSEIVDQNDIVDRICNGALKYKPFIHPRVDRFLVSHVAAPFMVRVMRGMNVIPVYQNDPRKLITTFRETAEAMKAGDNVLVFPEDSSTSPTGRYLREGVSEFFTGFVMIAQLYHHQTGRLPLFVPLYANKKARTITFCKPIRYDPEYASTEGKAALCRALREEMLDAAGMRGRHE